MVYTQPQPHRHERNRGIYPRGPSTSASPQNPARERILLSWSGGKDSAWALHLLRLENKYEVVALLTTINEKFRRVAIHGFREELLDRQAAMAGLPLWKIGLPFPCSNDDYESRMAAVCDRASAEGLHGIAFGDLFLEDIRAYRIEKLAGTGLQPIFPVWCADLGITTAELARQMIAAGLRAHLTCVDPRHLSPSFAGRTFDAGLLADLPAGVDPCGERGEFHSFAFAGPMFSRTVPVIPGETVERDNFIYADLLPKPQFQPQDQLDSNSRRRASTGESPALPGPDSRVPDLSGSDLHCADAGAAGPRRFGP